jgi:hypothetical protein
MTPEGIEPPIFGSGIRRVAIAPWSHVVSQVCCALVLSLLLLLAPTKVAAIAVLSERAVLAERLRRTLKARVRKSVGSIPTDCNLFFVFFFVCVFFLWHVGDVASDGQVVHSDQRSASATGSHQSAYSSVGRAGDCRWLQLISLGHWFDSGCADFLLFFFFFLLGCVCFCLFVCVVSIAACTYMLLPIDCCLLFGAKRPSLCMRAEQQLGHRKKKQKESCVRRELNPGPSLGKRRS